MLNRRRVLVVICLALIIGIAVRVRAQSIPERLSDLIFWSMSVEVSEEDGTFRSDNLLSNELYFQYVIPDLIKTTKPGRVYMGVGPEQNFTYIVAVKPRIAFIVDIRRGNKDLHLMYKALFEMSKDRAEFVGLLFSRKRPDGLDKKSSAKEIFDAYMKVPASEELYKANLKAIDNWLTEKHAFKLNSLDIDGIEYVYQNFFRFGPTIDYGSSGGGGGFG